MRVTTTTTTGHKGRNKPATSLLGVGSRSRTGARKLSSHQDSSVKDRYLAHGEIEMSTTAWGAANENAYEDQSVVREHTSESKR